MASYHWSSSELPLGAGSWKLEAGIKSAAVDRKPNSVPFDSPPARLPTLGGSLRTTIIPLAPPSLAGSSGLPGSFERAVLIALPYLALLRAGFCLPPVLPRARCALTAPFHHCQPQPLRASARQALQPAAGCVFSVPLSFELPRPGVTRRTALRSSDFPLAEAREAREGGRSSGLLRRRTTWNAEC